MGYGLALGGGGARWYAHIGVLQYIHEHNIAISEVAGTSMGSIIAAMFATGVPSQTMQHIFSQLSYSQLFDGSISNGLFGGQKMFDWLHSVFGDASIESCEIPLRIVAANIATGEKVVFDTWSIVDAVRSSIAFPGLVAPHEIDKQLYIDGGAVDNLPIDVLSSDDVIAVSVVNTLYLTINDSYDFRGFKIPKPIFSQTQKIVNNSLNIMIKRIEDLTIDASKKNVKLIRPDMQDYSMFDIQKLHEIVQLGYDEAKKVLG